MLELLQSELYQLENKQAKGFKLGADNRQELEGEKGSKTFLRVLERQNMNIPKSPKKNYEKLYTKQTSTAATTEFLSKIPNIKKMSNEHFNLCEAKIPSDEIIKFR